MDADKSYKLRIEARREAKKNILEAAAELMRELGYANVTLDQIAERLHISKVSIYHHWTSKKEIMFDLHRLAYKIMIESLEQIEKGDDTPDSKLKRAIVNHVSQAVVAGVFPLLPKHDWLVVKSHEKEIVRLRDIYEHMLRQIVLDGIKKRVFKKVDEKLLVFTILGAASYTWIWYSPDGSMSPEEIAANMADFILGGILAKARRKK